jgi:hypothetical protein
MTRSPTRKSQVARLATKKWVGDRRALGRVKNTHKTNPLPMRVKRIIPIKGMAVRVSRHDQEKDEEDEVCSG